MTTQEFENQLSELINQAPKEARNLILNLAVSANKSTDVKRIIMQAINISNTPD